MEPMSISPEQPQRDDSGLQFDEVTRTENEVRCATCSHPLESEYHGVNGNTACASCREAAEQSYRSDRGWKGLAKALLYGAGAALAGCLVYYLFIRITNIELGLMAIAVGWLVGRAVMKGSNDRGGLRYQILAVALTYFAITFAYVPLYIESFMKEDEAQKKAQVQAQGSGASTGNSAPVTEQQPTNEESAPANPLTILVTLILIVLAAPFLQGIQNILGIAIIGFGLWEAFRFTARRPLITGGPYPLQAKIQGAEPAV